LFGELLLLHLCQSQCRQDQDGRWVVRTPFLASKSFWPRMMERRSCSDVEYRIVVTSFETRILWFLHNTSSSCSSHKKKKGMCYVVVAVVASAVICEGCQDDDLNQRSNSFIVRRREVMIETNTLSLCTCWILHSLTHKWEQNEPRYFFFN
jgi:hypothetical protein